MAVEILRSSNTALFLLTSRISLSLKTGQSNGIFSKAIYKRWGYRADRLYFLREWFFLRKKMDKLNVRTVSLVLLINLILLHTSFLTVTREFKYSSLFIFHVMYPIQSSVQCFFRVKRRKIFKNFSLRLTRL